LTKEALRTPNMAFKPYLAFYEEWYGMRKVEKQKLRRWEGGKKEVEKMGR
jgi:hypothetical protein